MLIFSNYLFTSVNPIYVYDTYAHIETSICDFMYMNVNMYSCINICALTYCQCNLWVVFLEIVMEFCFSDIICWHKCLYCLTEDKEYSSRHKVEEFKDLALLAWCQPICFILHIYECLCATHCVSCSGYKDEQDRHYLTLMSIQQIADNRKFFLLLNQTNVVL